MLRMELDEDGEGSLDVEPSPWDRLVLVVCHLGGPDYDPDRPDRTPAHYEYSIEAIPPAPRVFFVEPGEIRQGTQQLPMIVEGDGFVRGDGLQVTFSGEGVVAELKEYVSPGRLEILVTAAAFAEPGPRDVTVTNPGGRSATAVGKLVVLEREPTGQNTNNGVDEPGPGRGCRATGRGGTALWLLVGLLALLGLGLRRPA